MNTTSLNVCLISHCGPESNSGLQVEGLRSGLRAFGIDSMVLDVSQTSTTQSLLTQAWPWKFQDGRAADILHAWTPREHVRRVTRLLSGGGRIPHIVHLEDEEEVILSASLGLSDASALVLSPDLINTSPENRIHVTRYRRFLDESVGVTALVDTLSRFVRSPTPFVTFSPGFQEAFAAVAPSRHFREWMCIPPETIVLVYPGNVHQCNTGEVDELYRAVLLIAERGISIRLIRTGVGQAPSKDFLCERGLLKNMGVVPRQLVRYLIANASVLVQPGGPGPFNDCRFPSKLPEFLISGKPVVLPQTNLGLKMRHGWNAWVMQRGDAAEIANVIITLAEDTALAESIGRRGRAFALSNLRWHLAARIVADFYGDCLRNQRHAD